MVSGEAAVSRSADRVIFPGVGQASAAMKKIQQRGIDKLLRIVPKLGYNFTRKEFYWSLNADFEYWPQKAVI